MLIQNPVCDCAGAWKSTQQRCGANRQEPKGRAKKKKVWHLLGRLGIHKPDPGCILKPAATDGCDMTERRLGGRVGGGARLGSTVSLVSPGSTRSLISPMFADEISMLKKPYRSLKDNQIKRDEKGWSVNMWMAVITARQPLPQSIKTSGRESVRPRARYQPGRTVSQR